MVKIRLRRMGAKKAPFYALLLLTAALPVMAVSLRRSATTIRPRSLCRQDRR